MSDLKYDPDTFYILPVEANPVTEDEVTRYLAKVEEAKARMNELGFQSLLDKKAERRPRRERRGPR